RAGGGGPPAAPGAAAARPAAGAGAGPCLPRQGRRGMSAELGYLGLAAAAELIRSKKLSPVEYAEALLGRIARHDSRINAFIAVVPERALTAARRAEAEIAAGRHAAVTERLEAAGAVLLGKLSTHEFAVGGPSFDLPWPPARNPWNRDHFP